MARPLTVMIIVLLTTVFIQETEEESLGQNETIVVNTSTVKNWMVDRLKGMNRGNSTSNSTRTNRTIPSPPKELIHEYLRCLQKSSIRGPPAPYSCPYQFEENVHVCWTATRNGTYASSTIEYDHGPNNFYDGVRYGIENCTLQRFCQPDGNWAITQSPDVQCRSCFGDGRPVKFNSISIMIETMSLSLSLVSLTIAVLCMINVKRLHLPRNLLHMHLFVAFIFRSIVKLVFIHSIMGGYTRNMITYTRDKCGNIEILAKSSNLFHVSGCRVLSSLFWYTDAVSQTFIFCEAMFLFTALTSHLFRDRSCLLFVLWGWLSPLLWLSMWVASHVITDRLKHRSTCWLEGDNTTYFYYFFYVPYAFYILVNFGIFLYLVRLLYTKYQSNNAHTNRSGNRHLIKSILILIPLFGLHSLFVMWVFYHKNQGHNVWYYIAVIFKAIFGDLQGFFTSLIYFYFNTEIRKEVLRQIHRTLLTNDAVRRSSAADTLSTRLSVFRISMHRRRQSSIPSRADKRRATPASLPSPSARQIYWRQYLACLCPCLFKRVSDPQSEQRRHHHQQMKTLNAYDPSLLSLTASRTKEDDTSGITAPLIVHHRSSNGRIDNEDTTCDTDVMRNDDEVLTDENDVTFHRTSSTVDPSSIVSSHTPVLSTTRNTLSPPERPRLHRMRSNSEGPASNDPSAIHAADNKSLR